jgi:hypothetical protein
MLSKMMIIVALMAGLLPIGGRLRQCNAGVIGLTVPYSQNVINVQLTWFRRLTRIFDFQIRLVRMTGDRGCRHEYAGPAAVDRRRLP